LYPSDHAYEKLDEGLAVDIIYLDFRKAFDSVPHERLLCKMQAYGIGGKVLEWVRNFLVGRSQIVRVGNAKSAEAKVLSGIPQGSILGPILFTIFINDLPDNIKSFCHIFADDTKIYNQAKLYNTIQDDLNNLQIWNDKWKLYFNVNKCMVMHIGKTNEQRKYFMSIENKIVEISKCTEEKDLGVTFDNLLLFDSHINRVITKACQLLGIINRSFKFLETDGFLMLYKSIIRPHLEYGNGVWYPFLKRQSVALEKVQRRATRMMVRSKSMTYGERLRFLKLYSLKGRRIRGDLIQAFKLFHNLVDIYCAILIKEVAAGRTTRNSDKKIQVGHTRLFRTRFSFRHRITKYWNMLPIIIKNAPTLNSFKNQLDAHTSLVKIFYEYDE
jgi:hypothetical protein